MTKDAIESPSFGSEGTKDEGETKRKAPGLNHTE